MPKVREIKPSLYVQFWSGYVSHLAGLLDRSHKNFLKFYNIKYDFECIICM